MLFRSPEADVVCDETDGKDVEGGAAVDAVAGVGRGVVPCLHAGEVAADQVVDFQAGGGVVRIRDAGCRLLQNRITFEYDHLVINSCMEMEC